MIDPFIDTLRFGKRNRLVFTAWYPFSWKISPNFELIYLIQILMSCYGVIITATIDCAAVIMVTHCCEQIDILCEKIKKFNGKIRHNILMKKTPDIKINCCCLKCIVDQHNYLVRYVYIIINIIQ